MSDLPPGWEWATLGEICERPQYGWTTSAEPSLEGPRLLRTTDISRGFIDWSSVPGCRDVPNDIQRYCLANGDIVVSRAGSVGLSHLVESPPLAVFASYLIRLRPVIVDPKYVALFLKSPSCWAQIEVAADGIAMPNINARKLEQVRITIPPLAEQRRIVTALEDHLSRLDAGLAYVRIGQRRLDALAKRVIIEAAPVPGRAHWRCITVGEAGRVDLGRQRHPDWHTGPNMRQYLRVANIFEDRIDLKDVKSMNFPPGVFDRFKLHSGDILLNEGQSPEYLGRPAMYRGKPGEFAFTNSLLRFRARPDVLPEWALLVFRRHMHARRFVKEVRITTNIAHLSAARFKSVEFPIPPLDEQKSIVSQTKESLSDIGRMSTALDTADRRAAKLRRSLLADAFVGRLVPQDPKEEPASLLLERIRAERAAQSKSKRTRRTKRHDTTLETLL